MSREAISPSEARALWPPSAQIHVDRGAPSGSPRLYAEKLVTVPAESTPPRPLSKFSIALALWVLPGGLLMQNDGQLIVGNLFCGPTAPRANRHSGTRRHNDLRRSDQLAARDLCPAPGRDSASLL